MIKLGAKELRVTVAKEGELAEVVRHPVYVIVDNVLDTYNIGAIFRLADAVGVRKVFLCAGSETPPNSRIKKASINTTEWVTWSYASTAVEALQELKIQNSKLKIIAIEQDERSVSYTEVEYGFPVALLVGHETEGVSREAMDLADVIVELPMWGVNKSLNVMVSLGIVLYKVMEAKIGVRG